MSQKKRNGGFSVPYLCTSLDKASSAWREWYQNHWIWLSNFDSMPISWNTVIFKFRLILRPMSVELYRERPFIRPFSAYTGYFVDTDQWASQNTIIWKAISDTILRSSVAKIKGNVKMTVCQEMGIESKLLNQIQWSIILVPFSSAEDALLNDVKKNMTLLDRRVLKNLQFRCFFWHPVLWV